MKDYILFDLDGTIVNSEDGIYNAIKYSLKKFGIQVLDTSTLKPFIGPPLSESFNLYYGFTGVDLENSVKYYREYYSKTGLYEVSVYDGVEDLLFNLAKAGKKLVLATSKPEPFAKEVMRHVGLDKYFAYIFGASFDHSRAKKEQVIDYALKTAKIDPVRAVMVGDRHHDIDGAKVNNLQSVGVLYGFGDLDELKNAKADYIVDTSVDLLNLLLKL
jgi:phosphoglycolate phosphatase